MSVITSFKGNPQSVTHVAGHFCYLSPRLLTLHEIPEERASIHSRRASSSCQVRRRPNPAAHEAHSSEYPPTRRARLPVVGEYHGTRPYSSNGVVEDGEDSAYRLEMVREKEAEEPAKPEAPGQL